MRNLGVEVDRVLFLRRRLAVVAAHGEVSGRLVTKSTKTRRRREVPIPGSLVEILAEHVAATRPPTGSCSPWPKVPIRHHLLPPALQAGRHRGRTARRSSFSRLAPHRRRHPDRTGLQRKAAVDLLGRHQHAIERYKHLFDGHEDALMGRGRHPG